LTIPSDVYNLNPDTRVIKINYSKDGGVTWACPSGAWKDFPLPENPAVIYFTNWQIGVDNVHNATLGGTGPFIFYDKTTNAIILGFIVSNFSGGYAYFTSNDNGNTWKPYNLYTPLDIAGELRSGYQHGSKNATKEYFLSPHDYTDEHLVSVGSLETTPPDVGDPNIVYSSQEAAFLKKVGYKFTSQERFPRSGMVITRLIDNVIIDRVEGNYI
jgi:hypothetical protein